MAIHFWLKYHQSEVASFSVYHIRERMLLICLITDEVHLDLLVIVTNYSGESQFPTVTDEFLGRRSFKTVLIY